MSPLTFNNDLGHSLDDAQTAHGHAGVVGRLMHAVQFQNVPSDWHVILRCQVLRVKHPLDIRHG